MVSLFGRGPPNRSVPKRLRVVRSCRSFRVRGGERAMYARRGGGKKASSPHKVKPAIFFPVCRCALAGSTTTGISLLRCMMRFPQQGESFPREGTFSLFCSMEKVEIYSCGVRTTKASSGGSSHVRGKYKAFRHPMKKNGVWEDGVPEQRRQTSGRGQEWSGEFQAASFACQAWRSVREGKSSRQV